MFSSVLIPARVSWIKPLPCRSDSVRTSFGLLLVYLDYLSALPCWILFADRRPTLALGLLSALSVSYLFADVFDPACFVTMSINKSLQMDQHASHLVGSVTEYSATPGSSGFSCGYWPGMETARLLLTLEQGLRSLEDYIQEYLDLAYFSDLPDCVLIDFFCEGINQPLKSRLICEGPRSSLSQFMDYALLTVGSAFTVGVAEERDTALTRVMAVAPEHAHKMAATAELDRKMADTTTSRSVTAANSELSQVTVDLRESSQVTVDRYESSQVTVDLRESSQSQLIVTSQAKSQLICQGLVTSQLMVTSQVTSQRIFQSPFTSPLIFQSLFSSQIIQSLFTSQLVIQSHAASQLVIQSHDTSQLVIQSHATSQLIIQSQAQSRLTFTSQVMSQLIVTSLFTSPLTFQSLFTSQRIFQSLFTSPLTIQNHVTSPLISQSLLTSYLPHPDIQGQCFDFPVWFPV